MLRVSLAARCGCGCARSSSSASAGGSARARSSPPRPPRPTPRPRLDGLSLALTPALARKYSSSAPQDEPTATAAVQVGSSWHASLAQSQARSDGEVHEDDEARLASASHYDDALSPPPSGSSSHLEGMHVASISSSSGVQLPPILPYLPLISSLLTLPLSRLLASSSATPDDVWQSYVSLMRTAPRGAMLHPSLLAGCMRAVARPGALMGGVEIERRKREAREAEEMRRRPEGHGGEVASITEVRDEDVEAVDGEEEEMFSNDGLVPAGAPSLSNAAALRILALLGALERGLVRARAAVHAARRSGVASEAATEGSNLSGLDDASRASPLDGHPITAAYLAALNADSTRRAVLSALTRARRGVAGEEVAAAVSWLNRVQGLPKSAPTEWQGRRSGQRVAGSSTATTAAPQVLQGRLIDDMLDLVSRSVNPHSTGLSAAASARDAARSERQRTLKQVAHLRLQLPTTSPRRYGRPASSTVPSATLPPLQAAEYDTMAAVRLFTTLWTHTRQPTLRGWGTYLAFEIRLASQRRRIRATYPDEIERADWDSWAPVREALARIAEAGALHVSHLNAAMYGAMRWRRADGLDEKWPSWSDVQTTYTALRGNLLQAEMRRAMFGLSAPLPSQQHAASERTSESLLLPSALHPLPAYVMPSHTTYTLLLTLATRQGDFAAMLEVLHDLTSTEENAAERAQRWQLAEARGEEAMLRETQRMARQEEAEEQQQVERQKMQPSLADFDAIFRGFAKHAIPSRFDEKTGSWVLDEAAAAAAAPHQRAWTMSAFEELFHLFLACAPRHAYPADDRAEGGARQALTAPLRRVRAQRQHGQETRRSSVSATTAAAPPPKALFFLLTAMRRVSGDDARWVLERWLDVEDKFAAPQPQAYPNKDADDHRQQRWTAWRPNVYTRNALEMLERRAQES